MVNVSADIAALFERDLRRLSQEIAAFPDDELPWATLPGVSNSAGNLVLHLEGNLREYIGRQLGGIAYTRDRPAEFSRRGLSRVELKARVDSLRQIIPPVIFKMNEMSLEAPFPEVVHGRTLSARQYLLHLYGHFHYHLGQIDYLRRVLTEGGAITFAQL